MSPKFGFEPLKDFSIGVACALSLYGLLVGLAFDPFLRWIGHPLKDRKSMWSTILCGLAFLVVLLLALRKHFRDRHRMKSLD